MWSFSNEKVSHIPVIASTFPTTMTLNQERGPQSIEPHTIADVEKVCGSCHIGVTQLMVKFLYQLVQKLYQPGSPQEVARIQDALQKLQRSQQGWQLADALLQSQDEKVRFFGALTFTIKINQDWQEYPASRYPRRRLIRYQEHFE